jgi:hypothetical protein
MKTAKAIERLSYTISRENKPNQTDKDALNKIIKDLNKQAEENVKEHYLFAKLYAVMLRVNTDYHGDIVKGNRDINEILAEPLELQLEKLLVLLKRQNLCNYLESKDIYDNLLNIESFDKYSKLFPNVNKEGMIMSHDAWDIDSLTAHFQFSVNQSIINFKGNV